MKEIISILQVFKYAFEFDAEAYVLTGNNKDIFIVIFNDIENKKTGIYCSEFSIMKLFDSREFNVNDVHSGELTKWIEATIHKLMLANFGERVDSCKLFVDIPYDTGIHPLHLIKK